MLALAAIYDGGSRSEAARLGDVTLQIVRDWVVRFNAEGPDGLIDRKAAGPKPLLSDAHRQALAIQIDRGPIPAAHGVVRWRPRDGAVVDRLAIAREAVGKGLLSGKEHRIAAVSRMTIELAFSSDR